MDALTTTAINVTTLPPSDGNQTGNGTIRQAYFGTIYVYGAITATTTLTNTVMLCFIIFERKLHTMSNWILASMFCVGIVYALVYLFPRWVMFVPWRLFNSYACQILPLVGSALIINFNLHLVLVSLDRYCCVIFPFHYNMPQAPIIVRTSILAAWVISFIIAFIPLCTFLVPVIGKCSDQLNTRSFHIYTLVAFIMLFYLPLFMLCVVYSRILWIVNIHTQRRNEILAQSNFMPASVIRRNLRAITYTAILIGFFMAFWLPALIQYAILFPTVHLGLDKLNIQLGEIFRYLSLAYPAISPLLYAYFTPTLRSEIYKKLTSRICQNSYKSSRSIYPEYS
ncbi:Histamine H2 receptor [Trichoplax sp. H2]|nr:Histamine H2 receptor [Trichoplax sp. H2]|eukprot:RDD37867.1 Histamine H2 receptor [Trichoplax sp. H2]